MSILIVLRGNEEENANEEKEACKFVRDGINKTFILFLVYGYVVTLYRKSTTAMSSLQY